MIYHSLEQFSKHNSEYISQTIEIPVLKEICKRISRAAASAPFINSILDLYNRYVFKVIFTKHKINIYSPINNYKPTDCNSIWSGPNVRPIPAMSIQTLDRFQ